MRLIINSETVMKVKMIRVFIHFHASKTDATFMV